MLQSWWRQALVALLFLLIASCSGGGCSSGCSSCGITPLAGGFPQKNAITNAASVRLTKPGLDFIGQNIPSLAGKLLGGANAGVVTFNVPTTHTSTSILGIITVNIDICPDGPTTTGTPPKCVAEIEIGKAALTIDAVTPHAVTVSGTIPIRLRDLPVNTSIGGLDLALGQNTQCDNASNPPYSDADFAPIPVTITLPLVAETLSPREGYTKVDTKNAVFNIGIVQDDLKICSHCGSVLSGVCDGLLGIVKGLVFTPLVSQIQGVLTSTLNSALCTTTNGTLPCPTGSHADTGDAGIPDSGPLPDGGASTSPSYKCVFDSDPTECVPTELGIDGHINLSSLLASISPGTTGALDFVLAAGGDMDPAPDADAGANGHTINGMTLGMMGGALPQPQSACVPPVANPIPTAIPIPDELKGDTLPNWPAGDPGPHLGIAINGRFLNYAMGSVYNSGLLCLGVSTENFQQLSTGLLSVLIGSMKNYTFEERSAPVAITTRPQAAPKVTIGGGTDVNKDPLLSILLPTFAIDFYVWSDDRYIRAFTYTADLTVPVNLQTGKDPVKNPKGGLLPAIGNLGITNGVLSNNQLITDAPAAVAGALSQVLGGIVGQVLGNGFSPIDLSGALSSLGLSMDIPAGGIRKLTKGPEQYMAIFADLSLPTGPMPITIDTSARLVEKTVHAEAMTLSTGRTDLAPSLQVVLGSPADDGANAIEYSWRLDQGTWSPWSPERDVTIRDPMLFFQAKHVLQVSARIVGHPGTQDPTPAEVAFAIDTLAPFVKVTEKDGAFAIDAWDVVSAKDALTARVRYSDASGAVGAWSAWAPLAQVKLDTASSAVDVEVKDEEENVGSVSSALIRGHDDPTIAAAGSGCGSCSTPAKARMEWPAVVAGLAAMGLLFARRRRGGARSGRVPAAALALGSLVCVAGTTQGCGCGSDGGGAAPPTTGCGSDCNQECAPGLPLGLIGAYTSIAKAKDGTIWVAGYDDAAIDPDNGVSALYGDLAVGKYDQGKQQVQWVLVDGLAPPPDDKSCPVNDPHGWRGGSLDSGPDVGLWTSLALDANDHPMVAYYDATSQALKFASSVDGLTWATHAVFANPGSDVGRYAKMIVTNGKPVIAFSTIEKGTGGHARSKVSIAHGNTATPASPGDWALEDALVDDDGPCRSADDCDPGQACLKTGGCTATVTGCTAACSASQACVTQSGAPACANIAQASDLHPYPNGVGDYIALSSAPQGLALATYDRVHGNLLGLTNAGGTWAVTILDGETGSRAAGTAVDTGDDGVGTSLYVAANGDWHVAYVNGITETLQYLFVPGGKPVAGLTAQKVDDGSDVDGQAFADGKHIVGDDSFLRANDDGTVVITYQDATAGTLRTATGASSPGKWERHAVAQPNRFGGFFPRFVPGDTKIINWWRWADTASQAEFGDVAIVAP